MIFFCLKVHLVLYIALDVIALLNFTRNIPLNKAATNIFHLFYVLFESKQTYIKLNLMEM